MQGNCYYTSGFYFRMSGSTLKKKVFFNRCNCVRKGCVDFKMGGISLI